MQKIIPLPYDSALKYTIARYYTPSGRCIQAIKYTGGREDVLLSSSTASPAAAASPPQSQPDSDKDTDSIPLVPPSSQLQARPLSELLAAAATPPEAPRKPQSPSSEGEDGVGQAIPDSERHSYFTKYRHRLVRDGGGIEPDFKVC